MKCHELALRIQEIHPEAAVKDVARLCLLLANANEETERLQDDDHLAEAWREISMRLQAATDQHAAMTDELDLLSRSNVSQLGPDQVWTLLRAIRVQSQVLQFYVGAPLPV